MPLGHLIALISNAHLRKPDGTRALETRAPFLLLLGMVNTAYRKTSCIEINPIWSLRFSELGPHGTGLSPRRASTAYRKPVPRDGADKCPASRVYPFFTMSRQPPQVAAEFALFLVWTTTHPRPGGARRDRTDDLLLAKQALSQLSYGPVSTLRLSTSRPLSRRAISRETRPPEIGGPGKI
jgi:hypothetical protein